MERCRSLASGRQELRQAARHGHERSESLRWTRSNGGERGARGQRQAQDTGGQSAEEERASGSGNVVRQV